MLRRVRASYARDGLEVVVLRSPSTEPSGSPQDVTDTSFITGVDGGGLTQVEGTSRHVPGATAAAYGIENPGTMFLIDREGRLAARVRFLDCPETREQIERVLGGRP